MYANYTNFLKEDLERPKDKTKTKKLEKYVSDSSLLILEGREKVKKIKNCLKGHRISY